MAHAEFPSMGFTVSGVTKSLFNGTKLGQVLVVEGFVLQVGCIFEWHHAAAALSKAISAVQCYVLRCSQSFPKVCWLAVTYFAASLQAGRWCETLGTNVVFSGALKAINAITFII